MGELHGMQIISQKSCYLKTKKTAAGFGSGAVVRRPPRCFTHAASSNLSHFGPVLF